MRKAMYLVPSALLALTACNNDTAPEPTPTYTSPNECPTRPCELPILEGEVQP